jgi:ABC-2 type transport system permease protein
VSAAAVARGGGFARAYEVFRQEFQHNLRRPLYWVLVLLLGFMVFSLSNREASISSGDARVGGTRAWITSEFAVTQLLIMMVSIIYAFFVSVGAGMSIIRDGDQKVGEILHSTRLSPAEYVWGKFAAQLASFVGVLALQLGLMMLFNHVMPHGENRDSIGPFALANYLKPALLFGIPLLVFAVGTSFAIGGLTRQPILVFVLPIMVLLFGAFFLWEWSPSWIPRSLNNLLMFVDLSGLRWINETWLNVDKGVDFYNQRPVGLDTLIVAQRAMCFALGLFAVLVCQLRFTRSLRGAAGPGRARAKVAPAPAVPVSDPAPLSALAMRSGAPGFWAATLEVARVDWRELWRHPGLYLFVPIILLQVFGNLVSVGAFDARTLNTPGILAMQNMNTLTLLICFLILFYTVESLQRERSSGFASIHDTLPIRALSILLGKCLTNVVLGLVIVFAALLGCMIVLLVEGTVPLSLGPFALVWGVLLIPTFILWTAFVCASFAITGNRFGAYIIGLVTMVVTGYFQARGRMSWTFNWDLWSSVRWSDLSLFELDRAALVLNRVMVLGLAAFFIALTLRLFARRESDAVRWLQALRPGPIARAALALLPFAALPLVCGVALAFMVHDGREGATRRKEARDYWAKNVLTWRDAPGPELAAADIDLVVDPDRGWLRSKGEYTVVNRTSDTLRQVVVTGGPHWRNLHWTMQGDSAAPENRARLYVFTPTAPLAPGDRLRIGFEFDGHYPGGISKNEAESMEFVLPSGVVLTGFSTTSFAPLLGYLREIGVERDKNKADPREYADDHWRGVIPAGLPMFSGWVDTHIRVTGPGRLQHNVTGSLVNERIENGKRITEWRSDAPVRAFNVIMGDWRVKRGDGVAVYYDARHPYNVDEMLEALEGARRWYGEWFAPYPWKELRLSEFPGLATYAQGPPTNISFSEQIGFLTKSEPKANAAFWVTAHEAAHQWWPCIAMSGDGPGGDVLSEGLAHFSTILLTEQVKGEEQRMAFCKQIEDRYANSRQQDSERPLVKVDGELPADQRIIYDRGGWAFWMLHRLMGREANLAAHREYLETYRDNRDHPLIEDYLAIMRRHAPDTAAFDDYVRQWFLGTVVPQFLIEESSVAKAGEGWEVRAHIKNTGTGRAPVEIAAVRGERYPKKPDAENAWKTARTSVTLGAGESADVVIPCAFEPTQLVVDPDVHLLMLERGKAEAPLKVKAGATGPVAAARR